MAKKGRGNYLEREREREELWKKVEKVLSLEI